MRSLVLCLLFSASASAQDYVVGQMLMTKSGAQITKAGAKIDWKQVSFPLVVKAVKGDWLDIGPAQIKKSDVVLLEHAIAYYTDYLEQNPTSSWAYNQRAIVWRQWGQNDKAIEDYTLAIRLNPKSAVAYSNRGNIWSVKRDLDAALKDFSEAIHLDPKYTKAYFRRGNVLRTKGQFDAALKDYDEAIRLDPKFAWAFNSRGAAWKAKGDFDAALKDYEEAVRLDPTYAAAYNSLAWVRATAKDAMYRNGERAVADAIKACDLTFWRDKYMLDTLAAAYAEAGDFNSAIQWQTKAIELAPEASKATYRLRLDLFLSGKPYREEFKLKQAE